MDAAPTDDPRTGTTPSTSGVLEELSRLQAFARETVVDFLELASLEARRAGLTLVWMIAGGLFAAVLMVSAWAGLMAALAIYFVSLGLLPVPALILVAAINLMAGAGMIYACVGMSCNLLFPATRRQLTHTSVATRPTP